MIDNYDFEDFKTISGMEDLPDFWNTELNTFANISDPPKVTGNISLFDLLYGIGHNFINLTDYSDYLTPKYIDGNLNPVYVEIKNHSKSVCYNSTYNGYKDSKYLKTITNLMFLDIDDFKSREEALAYKEKITRKYDWIISCNLSLSKLGLHIIILVDKISDNEDYNRKYDCISAMYFDNRLDSNAKSLTRHAVIPIDSSIYINYYPKVLNINEILIAINAFSDDKKSTRSAYKEEKIIYTPYTFSPVKELKETTDIAARVDGLLFEEVFDESEFPDPNIPLYFAEGIDVIEINLHPYKHQKVCEGNRNTTIGGISMRLIYLNTNHLKDKPDNKLKSNILRYMLHLNKMICSPPLQDKEVVNSVNSNWKKYEESSLDVSRLFVKKYFFWSKRCSLKPNEKRSYSGKKKSELTTNSTKEKIADAIEEVHSCGEKVTQTKVAVLSGLNVQTVKKYWGSEFKPLVTELNHLVKTNNFPEPMIVFNGKKKQNKQLIN